MMFYVLPWTLFLYQFSRKAPLKSSSWNTCSVCVEACTYHNVGKNFVKQDWLYNVFCWNALSNLNPRSRISCIFYPCNSMFPGCSLFLHHKLNGSWFGSNNLAKFVFHRFIWNNTDVIHLLVLFEHWYYAHCLDMNIICLFLSFKHRFVCLFMLFTHKNRTHDFHV